MSILDKAFYEKKHYWYRQGNRIAWWDRKLKLWTSYLINEKGSQISETDYANNKADFLEMEKDGFFDTGEHYYDLSEIKWNKFKYQKGV